MTRLITLIFVIALSLLASLTLAVERVDVQDPESELLVSSLRSATGEIEISGTAYRIDSQSRIYNDAGQAVRVMPGDRVIIVSVLQEDRGLPLLRELLVRRAP